MKPKEGVAQVGSVRPAHRVPSASGSGDSASASSPLSLGGLQIRQRDHLVLKLREHDEVGGDQTQQADGQARVHGDEAADAQRERPELDQLQKPSD
ncbi:hypothetical protein EVAR_62635_1, partial [Eumeta japonica]